MELGTASNVAPAYGSELFWSKTVADVNVVAVEAVVVEEKEALGALRFLLLLWPLEFVSGEGISITGVYICKVYPSTSVYSCFFFNNYCNLLCVFLISEELNVPPLLTVSRYSLLALFFLLFPFLFFSVLFFLISIFFHFFFLHIHPPLAGRSCVTLHLYKHGILRTLFKTASGLFDLS